MRRIMNPVLFFLALALAPSSWAGRTHFVHDFIEFLSSNAGRYEVQKLARRLGKGQLGVDDFLKPILKAPEEPLLRQLNLALLGGRTSLELDAALLGERFLVGKSSTPPRRGTVDLRDTFLNDSPPIPSRGRHQIAMVPGETYLLHLEGNSQIRSGVYQGMLRHEDGGFSRHFLDSKTGAELGIPTTRLVGWRKFEPLKFSGSDDLLLVESERIWKTLFSTEKYKARGLNFEMFAPAGEQKNLERMARQLRDFDFQMEQMGFGLPKNTRIQINPGWKGSEGPYASGAPVFSYYGLKKYESRIEILPMTGQVDVFTDPIVMFHERTHTVLLGQYSDEAFIHGGRIHQISDEFRYYDYGSAVQEGIADFIAAHVRNQPMITGVRDLERGIFFDDWGHEITHILDLGHHGYHADSLIFSSLLWKIRKEVGQERMSRLIKPLVDRLNLYWDSVEFSQWVNPILHSEKEVVQSLINEVEYFYSVWERMLREAPEVGDLSEAIRGVLKTEAIRLSLNLDRIQMMATDFRPNPVRLKPPSPHEMRARTFALYANVVGYTAVLSGGVGLGVPLFVMFTQYFVDESLKDLDSRSNAPPRPSNSEPETQHPKGEELRKRFPSSPDHKGH